MANIAIGNTAHYASVNSDLVSINSKLNATDFKTKQVSKSFFSSLLSLIGKALVVATFPVSLPLLWIASKIANLFARNSAVKQEQPDSSAKDTTLAPRNNETSIVPVNTDRTLAVINSERAIVTRPLEQEEEAELPPAIAPKAEEVTVVVEEPGSKLTPLRNALLGVAGVAGVAVVAGLAYTMSGSPATSSDSVLGSFAFNTSSADLQCPAGFLNISNVK